MTAMNYFERHRERFEQAVAACEDRSSWSAFAPTPAQYPNSESAQAAGKAAFEDWLGREVSLEQPGEQGLIGEEVSPYTRKPLDISYRQADPDALFEAAKQAIGGWQGVSSQARIGVLMEVTDRLYQRIFELAHATMHTSGQSFNMGYAGSGTNALDNGIEALVYAHRAMAQVPDEAEWQRDFGKTRVQLQKSYRIVPKGVAVCFACATFPAWNAYPAMMASLATGNAVIVKPHPTCVLPMAISVAVFREVLAEAGFDPNLVTMALDTQAEPIGKTLVKHPDTAIVDFTGSSRFGAWVEANATPAECFTETAGVNTVVLESCEDLDAVARSLATTLCLFSAQMCTSPQNIYMPRDGVIEAGRRVPADEVVQRLSRAVEQLGADPEKASKIMATIQSQGSIELLDQLSAAVDDSARVALPWGSYSHPEYPDARTATPLLLEVTPEHRDMYLEERFAPVGFLIQCVDADEALRQATTDVRAAGGLTAFVYSTDEQFLEAAEHLYAQAGAQLTCNVTGPMPLNFSAAYSDYHITGLNSAGNGTLTDLAFVASRFSIAQSRRPVVA